MAIPSSPVVKSQCCISTLVQASGSQPSLFKFMLLMMTFCTVTLLHSTGWITQYGASAMDMPSISTFLQPKNWIISGGKCDPSPKTLSYTGVPSLPICLNLFCSAECCGRQVAKFLLADPLMRPCPVIALYEH